MFEGNRYRSRQERFDTMKHELSGTEHNLRLATDHLEKMLNEITDFKQGRETPFEVSVYRHSNSDIEPLTKMLFWQCKNTLSLTTELLQNLQLLCGRNDNQ